MLRLFKIQVDAVNNKRRVGTKCQPSSVREIARVKCIPESFSLCHTNDYRRTRIEFFKVLLPMDFQRDQNSVPHCLGTPRTKKEHEGKVFSF
jgi:hypothetical protein